MNARSSILSAVATCIFASFSGIGAEHSQLKAFPQAKAGIERIVIVLPHKERGEENAFKVELIPGKVMQTDGVNHMRVGLAIEPRPLKGWGYTFYEVTGSAQSMSTLIGVPPGTKPVNAFVSGNPLMIRYNSRLPIVVYVPKGQSIQYRIWTASESRDASKG